MYLVDERDRVAEVKGVPRPDAGAPMPLVVADDHGVVLAYLEALAGGIYAVVSFNRPQAHFFGPPNDEALTGHPLWGRGLGFYGVFEVDASSWLRATEIMNRVHPLHNKQRYTELRHFIFTFHDKTFECLAKGLSVVAHEPDAEDVRSRLPILMTKTLHARSQI